jgi:predicted MPP superfamily phosphohydrolase
MKSKKLLKKWTLYLSLPGLALFYYAWQIEPFDVEWVEMEMEVENLPAELDGKLLMQISDTHIGDRFDYQYLIDNFQKAQKLNPDIVVYTGDFLAYKTPKQFKQLAEVAPYFVKGNLATLGVLGNHDYGKNWSEPEIADQIERALEKAGINILRNEKHDIHGLNILGMDDFYGTNFDGKSLMKNYDSNQANLVLCHHPDVMDLPIWNDYKGWVLAGHTHGGQVKFPFFPPPILPVKNRKYSSGKIEMEEGRTIYINRALGHTYQIRFNVRPEITLFRLKAKKI